MCRLGKFNINLCGPRSRVLIIIKSSHNEQKKTQPRNRLQKEIRSTHKDQKISKTNGFINFHINLKKKNLKKTRHCTVDLVYTFSSARREMLQVSQKDQSSCLTGQRQLLRWRRGWIWPKTHAHRRRFDRPGQKPTLSRREIPPTV
jgi:hypothetical protein